jgi:uncharacterized membrane protein
MSVPTLSVSDEAKHFRCQRARLKGANRIHADSILALRSVAMLAAHFVSRTRPLSLESDRPVSKTSYLAAALTLFVSAWAASAPARADFRLCNNTSNRVSIAIAYTDADGWVSEGWWNVKASGCETLVRGPLAAEFYYAYAMDERGGEWKGKAFMCTRDREFKINGRNDCFVRGFDRTGFFEIDTGKDSRNWTVQLTDPAQPQPTP